MSTNDQGDFILRFEKPTKPRRNPAGRTVGIDQQTLERMTASLNRRLALPVDVYISFQDCGDEADAYYDADAHQVTICNQLIDEYRDIFARKVKDPEKLQRAVEGATASTFFHELGHAIIDVWKLPVTGKEEDAADQLSTLVLISRSDNGEEMALLGAVSFKLYAELDKGTEKIYWDEHSLDEQRFYDTICLVYGHHPDKYSYLVREGILPQERAEICPEEFVRVKRSWQTLIAPYVKQTSDE